MTGDKLGRLIFNTGYREDITRKNFIFPPSERISLDWTIKKAKEQNGVDLDTNIILDLETHSNSCSEERTDVYKAVFSYVFEGNKEPFLFSFGARNSTSCQYIWPAICREMRNICKQEPPIPHQPAAPLAIDVFIPCPKPEAMAYLYNSNCYEFCSRLGWALLYPECLRI